MDHLHMKSIESFSLQKLMQLAPYSFIEIEFNDDYILKNIRFINPERFYSLFKDQFDYPISYDEFYDQFIQKIEQNPEGIFEFIAEKEKALIDCLYLFSFGKYKFDVDSIDFSKFDKIKLHKYLKFFPKKTIKVAKKHAGFN